MIKKNQFLNENIISISFVLLIIFFIFPFQVTDTDFFFHIKYGEYFLNNRTWQIDHSLFSWTKTDSSWIYISWLGDIVFFIIYKFSDFWGIIFLQWFVIIFILFLYLFFIYKLDISLNNKYYIILILFFISIIPHGILPTNELFSLLFFNLTVFLYFYSKKFNSKFLLLVPIIFLIWVNTHGGFIIGLAFINSIIILDIIKKILIYKRKEKYNYFNYHTLTILLSNLVIFISPKKWNYIISIIKSFFISTKGEQFNTITAYMPTYKFLFSKNLMFDNKYFASWSFLIICFIFLYKFYQLNKEKKAIENVDIVIINIIFMVFSFLFIRNILYFPIIFVYSISYKKYFIKQNSYKFAKINNYLMLSTILTFLIVRFFCFQPFHQFTPSQIQQSIPKNEVKFLIKNNLPKPIFNDYKTGNYIIWKAYPKYKTFIDARYGPYEKTLYNIYFHLVFRKPKQFTTFLNNNNIKTVIINLEHTNLISQLISSDNWQLIYLDINSVIFIQKKYINNLNKYKFNKEQFKSLKNPVFISNLFKFFILYNHKNANYFIKLYKNNVCDFYTYKNDYLNKMRISLNLIEKLQQKTGDNFEN